MKNKKGFTLIELLAVIVILAVIALIAVPLIMNVIDDSKQKSFYSNINSIEEAADMYSFQTGSTETIVVQDLVDGGYLNSIPVDPRDNTNMGGEITFPNGIAVYNENTSVEEVAIYNGVHNTPKITDNMYPVKWNGTAWEVTTVTDTEWYTYNGDIANSGDLNDGEGNFQNDKWANITITTTNLSVGDIVTEANLNMYVWIPRYTYLLNETNKTIAIKYSNEVIDDITDSYISHPAFTFGIEELLGIWVAKFEMSSSSSNIDDWGTPADDAYGVSRPNVAPWRNISTNDMFLEARTIETELGISADSHMIKSAEWSAVAYLTEAIRDGEDVWINNQGNGLSSSRGITTGCAGVSISAGHTGNSTVACATGYKYNEAGVKASTTGNIYGIYDMSGGSMEIIATYINDDTNSRLTSATYALSLASADSKYKEMFDISGTSKTTNYTNASAMTQGLAIHETSTSGTGTTGWYSGFSYFPYSSYPILDRGASFLNGSGAGIFTFHVSTGQKSYVSGWRTVIVS